MNRATCLMAVVYLFACIPARAGDWRWSALASLGASSGDLKDTAGGGPGLGLGVTAERPVRGEDRLRVRLDGLFLPAAHRTGTGTTAGVDWTRRLDTRVQGWSLGAEYLFDQPFGLRRLSAGGGLAAVRWTVDATSTLDLPGAGTVVEASRPSWTKLGAALVADCRLTGHLRATARLLSCPYGWEGERVNVAHLGLAWTF